MLRNKLVVLVLALGLGLGAAPPALAEALGLGRAPEKITWNESPHNACEAGVMTVVEGCDAYGGVDHIIAGWPQSQVETCRQECDECCQSMLDDSASALLLEVLRDSCDCLADLASLNVEDAFVCLGDQAFSSDHILQLMDLLGFTPGGSAGVNFLDLFGPDSLKAVGIGEVGTSARLRRRLLLLKLLAKGCSKLGDITIQELGNVCHDRCEIFSGGVPEPGPEEEEPSGGGGGGGDDPDPFGDDDDDSGNPFDDLYPTCTPGDWCLLGAYDGVYNEYCRCERVTVDEGIPENYLECYDRCWEPDPYDPYSASDVIWCALNC